MTIYLFSLQAVSLLLPEIPKVELRARALMVILLTFCVSGCLCNFRFSLQFRWRYFSRILSIKSQGRNVGNGLTQFLSYLSMRGHLCMCISKTITLTYLSYLYPNLVPRVLVPFTSEQLQEKDAIFDWLLKNGFISWYLVIYFMFLSLSSRERCPKHCGRVQLWRKNLPYFQKTRGLRTYMLYTAVSRSGFTSWYYIIFLFP